MAPTKIREIERSIVRTLTELEPDQAIPVSVRSPAAHKQTNMDKPEVKAQITLASALSPHEERILKTEVCNAIKHYLPTAKIKPETSYLASDKDITTCSERKDRWSYQGAYMVYIRPDINLECLHLCPGAVLDRTARCIRVGQQSHLPGSIHHDERGLRLYAAGQELRLGGVKNIQSIISINGEALWKATQKLV